MDSLPGLNTRETAVVAWLLLGFAAALSRAEVRASIGALIKTVFGSRILAGLLVTAIGYTAFVVVVMRWLGFWDWGMTKTTVVWFLGTALARTYSFERRDAAYFRRLLVGTVALPVVVEFLANLHTFPLIAELVLVLAVFVLVMLQVVASTDPKTQGVGKACGYILSFMGLIVLALSVRDVIHDVGGFLTAARAKEYVLPLLLTACFLPYLYVVALYGAYQTTLHMVRFGLRGEDRARLFRFARRSILRACGIYPARTHRFEQEFRGRLFGASSEEEIKTVVESFRDSLEDESQRAA